MHRFFCLAACVLLLQPWVADCQYYRTGIGKTTHAVSNASAALEFFLKYLPATIGAFDNRTCVDLRFCTCGQVGRVGLDSPAGDTDGGFAIHTVHTNSSSERPVGHIGPEAVDRLVSEVFAHSVKMVGYDAFQDSNTGFWVGDLDPYMAAFTKDNIPILPIEWSDDINGKIFYSFQVQVATTNVVLEFMSGTQTRLPSPRHIAQHPRFIFRKGETPERRFGNLTATSPRNGMLFMHAARVSHYSSDIERDFPFYRDALMARVLGERTVAGVRLLALDFARTAAAPNYVQLHLVQRPLANTTGWLSVADLEKAMNSLHLASIKTDVCGYDQWMDSHYSLNTGSYASFTVGELAPKLKELKQKFHLLGPPKDAPYPANETTRDTLYVTTPNGITVEIKDILRGSYIPSRTPIAYGIVGGLCGLGNCSRAATGVEFV